MVSTGMEAHVKRISRQDKIATVVLTAIVGFVIAMLAAIVLYILVSGAGKLFDISFLTGKPQQFKAGGGIGPELFNSFYLLFITRTRMGMLNMVSATAPAMIENPQPMYRTKNKKPNKPTTIDGRLESVSIAVFAAAVIQLSGAYCERKIAAPSEIGTLISSVINNM